MADKNIQLMDSGGANNLFPKVKVAIDTSNVIASSSAASSSTFTYTATQDCWVTLCGYQVKGNTITINSVTVSVLDGTGSSGRHMYGPFFLRSGDIISFTNNGSVTAGYKVFGCK